MFSCTDSGRPSRNPSDSPVLSLIRRRLRPWTLIQPKGHVSNCMHGLSWTTKNGVLICRTRVLGYSAGKYRSAYLILDDEQSRHLRVTNHEAIWLVSKYTDQVWWAPLHGFQSFASMLFTFACHLVCQTCKMLPLLSCLVISWDMEHNICTSLHYEFFRLTSCRGYWCLGIGHDKCDSITIIYARQDF